MSPGSSFPEVAASTYERRAEETRLMARSATSAHLRAVLDDLAATYDRLARQKVLAALREKAGRLG